MTCERHAVSKPATCEEMRCADVHPVRKPNNDANGDSVTDNDNSETECKSRRKQPLQSMT
jgi:hypothetical protein